MAKIIIDIIHEEDTEKALEEIISTLDYEQIKFCYDVKKVEV